MLYLLYRSAVYLTFLGANGSIGTENLMLFLLEGKMKKKWDLYLYYNGICIKKIKIKENEAPAENTYVINVWFKKQIFRSNHVQVIVRPQTIIKNDEKNKKTYWGVVLEEGIRI